MTLSQPKVAGGSVYTPSGSAKAFIPGSSTSGPLTAGSQTSASSVGITIDPQFPTNAYWVAHTDGTIDGFYNNVLYPGSPMSLSAPIAGITVTPNSSSPGGWLVGTDGGVFTFGSAGFYGRYSGDRNLMVAIVSSPSGNGYWEIGADGGVFAYGDAPFRGSLPGQGISVKDVVSATTFADGYCMVEANGYYACFYSGGWGRAEINPSGPFNNYVDPATTITADFGTPCSPYPAACGGWISDRQGHVYTYNGAVYEGGLSSVPNGPIMGSSGWGNTGYRLVGADGGVFCFGSLPYEGSNLVDSRLSSKNAQDIGEAMLPQDNWGTWAEWNQGAPASNGVASGLLPLYDQEDSGTPPPNGTWIWSIQNQTPCVPGTTNYAYGIPQACPGSKMSTQGPALPNWQTNAWTQIAWGLWYIWAPLSQGGGNYGDPDYAYQYDITHNGYAPTA